MFEPRDLFQWDRFITPTIIKTFYWLVIALTVLFGISGIFSGLAAMAVSPFGGFIVILSSLAGVVVGIMFWMPWIFFCEALGSPCVPQRPS